MGADARDADRVALKRLVEQYARGADTRDGVLYADAFTDEAVLVTNRGEIRGRAALEATAPKLARYEVTMHLVGNHYVEFDGDDPDRATGLAYCIANHVHTIDDVRRIYVMNIAYHDDYVRLDGCWRIAHRRLELLWDEDRPLRS